MSGRQPTSVERTGNDRRRPRVAASARRGGALVVEELAGSALFQDLGRQQVASGVPVGGAFDRRAHRLALALVGGSPDQASVEIVGRIVLRARSRALVAVTGQAAVTLRRSPRPTSPSPDLELTQSGSDELPSWTALELGPEDALCVTTASRAYLGVRGGVHCPTVLGSRSTCLLGPIGPEPISLGQVLDLGSRSPADARPGDFCRPAPREGAHLVVGGPHGTLERVEVDVLEVSRIGVRLAPKAVRTVLPERTDLPSLGVLPGTIQALPSGDWMLLGPDAGTMGGYPVLGVLAGDGLDRWAHVRPGDRAVLAAVPRGSVRVAPVERVVRVGEIG